MKTIGDEKQRVQEKSNATSSEETHPSSPFEPILPATDDVSKK